MAERQRRELQRDVPRRVPRSRVVRTSAGGADPDRAVAVGVQHEAATQQPRVPNAGRSRLRSPSRSSPHHDRDPVITNGPQNGDSPVPAGTHAVVVTASPAPLLPPLFITLSGRNIADAEPIKL